MISWIDRRRTRRWQFAFLAGIFLLGISSLFLLLSLSFGMEEASTQDSLILNVYLDPAGKALVTGYADNISGLDFLATSEYQYENDTHRLYALTDGLTAKTSQVWTLNLDAEGLFEDYRITFYLPGDMRLGQINASLGLQYHLSAFNDSLVADVQGYEVQDPSISIQYQQTLAAGSAPFSLPAIPPGLPPGYPGSGISLILLLAGAFILAIGSVLGVILRRRRHQSTSSPSSLGNGSQANADPTMSPALSSTCAVSGDECSTSPGQSVDESPPPISGPSTSLSSAFANGGSTISSPPSGDEGAAYEHAADIEESRRSGTQRIQLSREMEAVIQTLTHREQAVISTLVEHGGRMTQAEIRYETKTPKSSLTGILISLERRKLVTKKEWGRTNIIELSDWFLSQRERS
ncbi:MAG: hypothetical protein KBB04_03730 [Methanothrix sp.]|uniref:DUF7343 domain-containing protein n=1 Tax=Methanothrix sp. TaxID=90426 RepID=UPI001B76B1F7|nr:hypothetical protein [Methanothrix sp.]MBP7067372.1 hypothetical protein [Methanothrix sp.]